MTDLLKKEAPFLRYFVQLTDAEKKSVAKHLTKSQLTAISQILYNAIKGRFKIVKSALPELKRNRTSLYKIAEKKTSLGQKKSLISRRIRQVTLVLNEGLKWIPK